MKKTCEHRTAVDVYLAPNAKCKQCRHEVYKRHYEKNREQILLKASEYRKKNPEKVKKLKADYFQRMKSVSFIKKDRKDLTGKELAVVNELKTIIVKISTIQRRYNKFIRIKGGGS